MPLRIIKQGIIDDITLYSSLSHLNADYLATTTRYLRVMRNGVAHYAGLVATNASGNGATYRSNLRVIIGGVTYAVAKVSRQVVVTIGDDTTIPANALIPQITTFLLRGGSGGMRGAGGGGPGGARTALFNVAAAAVGGGGGTGRLNAPQLATANTTAPAVTAGGRYRVFAGGAGGNATQGSGTQAGSSWNTSNSGTLSALPGTTGYWGVGGGLSRMLVWNGTQFAVLAQSSGASTQDAPNSRARVGITRDVATVWGGRGGSAAGSIGATGTAGVRSGSGGAGVGGGGNGGSSSSGSTSSSGGTGGSGGGWASADTGKVQGEATVIVKYYLAGV